jgi:hypothetical protein
MNLENMMYDDVNFAIEFDGDGVEYFDYSFYGQVKNVFEYRHTLNKSEIEQLRNNCKKLLSITDWVEN